MTTINREYKAYLNSNFRGQKIHTPLFFNGDFGLRFDLQKGETNTEEYFTEVDIRSSALFAAAFDPNDKVFLVYKDFKWKRRKIRFSNYCFKQVTDLNRGEVSYSLANNLYEKDDIYNVAIVKLKADRINYKNILKAISNTDFPPRQPRFRFLSSIEIYFVNTTKNLIFHMYDDRGLDIIASDIEILRPIYIKFNDWILKANREKIDKLIANSV